MRAKKLEVGRKFFVRAEYNSDIIAFVTELAKKHEVVTAAFTAIGALKCAKLGFYDQEKQAYSGIRLKAPQEIACCVGNISVKSDEPFVHAHAVLADQNGTTRAGHLLEGIVFAAEIHLTEFLGEKILRKKDAITGLSLWDI